MLPKGSFPKQLFKPTNYSSLKQEKQRQKNKKPHPLVLSLKYEYVSPFALPQQTKIEAEAEYILLPTLRF